MRVLILHQNRFYKVKYDVAIDHERADVCYAGTREYLDQVPPGLRHTSFEVQEGEPVLAQLQAWMRTQAPFDRILTRQENLMMTAAQLREEFSIPGMNRAQTDLFRDKILMKRAVAAKGLRVPLHARISADLDVLPWTGKTVLKPVDGAGSRDITLFPTSAQALAHVREALARDPQHPYTKSFELEEFITGTIWHVDGYLYRGEPVIVKTSRYVGTCLDYAFGQPLGSVQADNPQLAQWALKCLGALGAREVTFHLEAIASPDGPVFLEVAGRAGGGDIVELIERATGVNLHVLDMGTEVAGELAERYINIQHSAKKYGFFLLPGHLFKGAPCQVLGADELLESPLVENFHRLPPTSPTHAKATYQALDVPLSGIVSSLSSDELENWMHALFSTARVVPVSA